MRRLAVLPHLEQPHLAELLYGLRKRAGLSCHRLAIDADLDPSYVSRLEHGNRVASRIVLNALAESLRLTEQQRTGLLMAGGYVPNPLPKQMLVKVLGLGEV